MNYFIVNSEDWAKSKANFLRSNSRMIILSSSSNGTADSRKMSSLISILWPSHMPKLGLIYLWNMKIRILTLAPSGKLIFVSISNVLRYDNVNFSSSYWGHNFITSSSNLIRLIGHWILQTLKFVVFSVIKVIKISEIKKVLLWILPRNCWVTIDLPWGRDLWFPTLHRTPRSSQRKHKSWINTLGFFNNSSLVLSQALREEFLRNF